jgi:hypothetical protein
MNFVNMPIWVGRKRFMEIIAHLSDIYLKYTQERKKSRSPSDNGVLDFLRVEELELRYELNMLSGNNEQAFEDLEKIIMLAPENFDARRKAGDHCMRQGKLYQNKLETKHHKVKM